MAASPTTLTFVAEVTFTPGDPQSPGVNPTEACEQLILETIGWAVSTIGDVSTVPWTSLTTTVRQVTVGPVLPVDG